MSNKTELIDRICQYGTEQTIDRTFLEKLSIVELQNKLLAIAEQHKTEQQEALLLDQDKVAGLKAANEYLTNQLKEHKRPQFEVQQRESEAADRKTFADAARNLGFSLCEANFSLIRQTLGSGFSVRDIKANSLRLGIGSGYELVPATHQELDQWETERIQARNEFLKNADPQTLRMEAKKEAEVNRVAAQQTQANELDQKLQQPNAFPPLPEQDQNGKRIDAAYLNRLTTIDLGRFRALIKKHGGNNVTKRLRGLN